MVTTRRHIWSVVNNKKKLISVNGSNFVSVSVFDQFKAFYNLFYLSGDVEECFILKDAAQQQAQYF